MVKGKIRALEYSALGLGLLLITWGLLIPGQVKSEDSPAPSKTVASVPASFEVKNSPQVATTEPVIREVIVYRERVIRVYVNELVPFKSLSELKAWVADNYIKDAVPCRCVDTALELCKRAWRDGYQMSTEIVGDGKSKGHMICSTIIGDKIYFIEPGHTAVWLAGISYDVSGN